MNVLLITDSYPPEIRSASHLMQELAEGLRDRGHKISVVTSYPKYNLSYEKKKVSFPKFTVEEEIEVLRIHTLPHHKVTLIVRGISQLTMPYIFSFNIKKYINHKIDVVIVYSPPLPLTIVGKKLKMLHGAKFILNVQDIFPQNAIDLGGLKNKFMIKFFEKMEKSAYKCANRIVVHSESNRDFLQNKKGVPEDKIDVIYNWVDTEPYRNVKRTGRFRKLYGLDNKFVFLFAGVIGPSQGLDMVVKMASKLKEIHSICFLLVGDGTEKDRLIRMTESYGFKNVLFKAFVSKEEYPDLVKDMDVGLVCLSSKNKTPVVPGKILGYMAASKPVVAFLHKESDGHSLIEKAKCGFTAVSDDEEKMFETILKVYNKRDKLSQYGENGFQYISTNFEKNVCIDKLEKLF
ncbi:MAG: glycosyltransferase family 4 protein [Thermodesulfovibrionales bacterium]|nr:glycosyltransferase family 4 protein [Thermodesulfovibrionales bacterium]